MRWTREGGGQQVLDAHVQVLSRQWNPFWALYLEQRSAACCHVERTPHRIQIIQIGDRL
ncbi:MAG: hypothetical protein U1E76_24035 [Planctomycetota bacterium]